MDGVVFTPPVTISAVVDDDVFGDGCGTAAGAGLTDDVGGCCCALGDTTAPEFIAFLPRKLCFIQKEKIRKTMQIFSLCQND